MELEGYTRERGDFLVLHSKWAGRLIKSKQDLRKITREDSSGYFDFFPNTREHLIYTEYRIPEDTPIPFNTIFTSRYSDHVSYLLSKKGNDGEAYQDIFDTCFCEEWFVPLENKKLDFIPGRWYHTKDYTPPIDVELECTNVLSDIYLDIPTYPYTLTYNGISWRDGIYHAVKAPVYWRVLKTIEQPKVKKGQIPGWIRLDEKTPYDGQECDILIEGGGANCIQTTTYKIMPHPGGDGRQSYSAFTTDEEPMGVEEPIFWRPTEDNYLPGAPLPDLGLEGLEKMFVDPKSYESTDFKVVTNPPQPPFDWSIFDSPNSTPNTSDDDYYASL